MIWRREIKTQQRKTSNGRMDAISPSVWRSAKRKTARSLSASRRLRKAIDRGYLVNLETRKGRPARVVLGDPMPEMVKLLPEPGELAA
jgi:hypothetical protein